MNFTHHLKRMQVLLPPTPWARPRVRQRKDADVVVLLHGLWRSVWAMEPMAQYLHDAGFETVNLPYASFRYDLDQIVVQVRALMDEYVGQGRRVHFVTHSLGGVVVKHLLEQVQIEKIGRVVMLAPPHRGSEIVDWLSRSPVGRVLGPAGEFLTTKNMRQQCDCFPEKIEAAILMGEKRAIPFFRKLLEDSNDGIVSVTKGKIYGIKEFKVVPADHTFIASEPEVLRMVGNFLQRGRITSESVVERENALLC